MKRPTWIAVAAGVLGALLLVAAWRGSMFGVVFGVMFSPLPLAMMVLGLGLTYLPVAAVGGAVAVATLTGSFALAAVYLVVDAAPAALLVRLGLVSGKAGEGPPATGAAVGKVVCWLVLFALGLMVLGLAMMPLDAGGVEETLRSNLSKLLAEAGAQTGGELADPERREGLARALAGLLPGAAAWNLCLRAILSAVVAQAVLARMNAAQWTTPAYRRFAVPGWFIAVFWAMALTGWVAPGDAGFVATNAAMALCLPLMMQGLAVAHCGAARMDHSTLWLVGLYVLALAMAGVALVLLVILGVVDHFLKLRARMDAAGHGGGTWT